MAKKPKAEEAPKPTGRPTSFNDTIADAICERLGDGESLRSVCCDEDMPNKATVFRWLAAHESFRDQYARARETQADSIVDEMLDIADDASNDWMEKRDKDGANIGWQENGDAMQRSRLRIDARKWMASKMAPKKYGDRQVLEHTDPHGNNPFTALLTAVASNGRPRPKTGD